MSPWDLPQNMRSKVMLSTASDCWVWTGARNPTGYGSLSIAGRAALAHRESFEHFKGPIPEGLHIDHICERRNCVNPEHLQAVTQSLNSQLVHVRAERRRFDANPPAYGPARNPDWSDLFEKYFGHLVKD